MNMRLVAPVACPACLGWRSARGEVPRRSMQSTPRRFFVQKALDEREVQAEIASTSEGLQHNVNDVVDKVRAGFVEGGAAASISRSEPQDAPAAGEREAFWGRIAVLILGAVLVSERITGKGAVQSLDLAVGVPLWEIEPFLAAVVIGLVYVGLRFPKGKRAAVVKGAQGEERVRAYNETWRSFLQRFACLTLAGTIVAEVATGKGLLALLQIETGVEALTQYEAAAIFLVVLILTSAGDAGNADSRSE